MSNYRIKAVRKIDGFRAEMAGTDKLTITEFDLKGEATHEEAAWILVGIVLDNLKEGDGENGGKGDLTACARDIFHALRYDGKYSYADLEFTLIRYDHDWIEDQGGPL